MIVSRIRAHCPAAASRLASPDPRPGLVGTVAAWARAIPGLLIDSLAVHAVGGQLWLLDDPGRGLPPRASPAAASAGPARPVAAPARPTVGRIVAHAAVTVVLRSGYAALGLGMAQACAVLAARLLGHA